MEQDINYWLAITPFELSENDQRSLLTPTNEEWTPHTWEELKGAIENLDLSILTRWPTDMRKYLLWRREMDATYTDIAKFVATERLGWDISTEHGFDVRNPTPLADPADYVLRRNDWPYSVEPGIEHVIVWLKTRIPVDELGDPTPESTIVINNFVERIFRGELNNNNSTPDVEVIWFKNRTRWQSVRALEHVHVMTKGVDQNLIEKWTGQKESDIIANSWSYQRVLETGKTSAESLQNCSEPGEIHSAACSSLWTG